jgi:hypothetical protein
MGVKEKPDIIDIIEKKFFEEYIYQLQLVTHKMMVTLSTGLSDFKESILCGYSSRDFYGYLKLTVSSTIRIL